jgi:glycosyltransferase involved in cell wall biosynthesis
MTALHDGGGFDTRIEPDIAVVDLCLRLRPAGGTILAVGDAVVADHRPVRSRAALTDPFADQPAAWARIVDDHGPALYRTARPDAPLRVAITTAAPSRKVAARWGDWHFGHDLAHALVRAGYEARVQTAGEAVATASRACDIHLVLHGLVDVTRTRGQRHVLWVISHPETLTAEAVAAADLVFVASERFVPPGATSTPVEVMLQATDQHRYTPEAADPRDAHDVVVVAKTRTIMRPMVADALAAGLRPAIFGTGWEAFVDPALIVTPYLANDAVPAVYASAGVVLNDHWDSMREHGFVSNRIFDALACGAPVISDAMPDIPALFRDAVPMYRDAAELGALVRHDLADREIARARAARGRAVVLANHTFDQRVSQLVAALVRHHLVAIA